MNKKLQYPDENILQIAQAEFIRVTGQPLSWRNGVIAFLSLYVVLVGLGRTIGLSADKIDSEYSLNAASFFQIVISSLCEAFTYAFAPIALVLMVLAYVAGEKYGNNTYVRKTGDYPLTWRKFSTQRGKVTGTVSALCVFIVFAMLAVAFETLGNLIY